MDQSAGLAALSTILVIGDNVRGNLGRALKSQDKVEADALIKQADEWLGQIIGTAKSAIEGPEGSDHA